jgi:hypothetical protein
MKNLTKKLVLTTQSIFKFVHFRRETIIGEIITYIRVGVRLAPRRSSLGHEAQPGEVAFLALDRLILFRARGVFSQEVKVAQGSTRLGYDLLEVLLLVSKAVLLPVVTLVAGVISVGIVVLVGVKLLPLRAIGDEMSSVAALKIAPG